MAGTPISNDKKLSADVESATGFNNSNHHTVSPAARNNFSGDDGLLAESSFNSSLLNNSQDIEGLSPRHDNITAPGIVSRSLNTARDFISGMLDAIGTWSTILSKGVGRTIFVLSDYASQSLSKVTQNIATPETNQAVAETIETVTPAIGYGVGKTVGSTVSGLAAGLKGLFPKN